MFNTKLQYTLFLRSSIKIFGENFVYMVLNHVAVQTHMHELYDGDEGGGGAHEEQTALCCVPETEAGTASVKLMRMAMSS